MATLDLGAIKLSMDFAVQFVPSDGDEPLGVGTLHLEGTIEEIGAALESAQRRISSALAEMEPAES